MKQLVVKIGLRLLASISVIIFLVVGGIFVMRQSFQQSVLSKASELNENGGISEVREIVLGDIKQYIALEGESLDHPVCLFLHGGPGLALPYGISSRHYLETISSQCMVVYWDQRGSGKTFSMNSLDDSITFEQVVEDAKQLISYLIEAFDQDKIYLIGYSWGSVLGMELVSEIPEQLHAYFGLSQVVNPSQSQRQLYDWLIEEFTSVGNNQAALVLKQLGAPPYNKESSKATFQQLLTRSDAYVKWNEGLPNVNILSWMIQVFSCPDLTWKEAYDTLIKASSVTLESDYWQQIQRVDLTQQISGVNIPVYFAMSREDYICSLDLLQHWVEGLNAPKKEILILEDSAHYFSRTDEEEIYDWMKQLIVNKISPDQETERDEVTVESILSNLLQ